MSCNHNCSSCENKSNIFQNRHVDVKHVIAVMSGKGGVGKSTITSMLAVTLTRQGYKCAILDADITGPSINKIFGITNKASGINDLINPNLSDFGIQIISMNSFLEQDTDPILWRGPIVNNVIKQFWNEVNWKDVDYMFIDMPPGTGEVSLTVLQSLPVDGVIIVTTPQDLVSMIVEKSINMVQQMNKKILGIVENMAYFVCDNCGKKHQIFGNDLTKDYVNKFNINNFVKLPINSNFADTCDAGGIERLGLKEIENFAKEVIESI